MGCDIHTVVEIKINDEWEEILFSPFYYRSYSIFGFLANVRNYSMVPSISEPRGLPDDCSEYIKECLIYNHSHSWLSIDELKNFNYDVTFEDRRTYGATIEGGKGEMKTIREFLGECFFEDLNKLIELNADRIIFWFDN